MTNLEEYREIPYRATEHDAVYWAVSRAVYVTVYRAVGRALDGAVFVDDAVYVTVYRAVYVTVKDAFNRGFQDD